jgi:hypothetical protein
MMMMIGFDSCIRQHPTWASYEELIDHLLIPWRNELNDTMILSRNRLLFTLKVWTCKKEREGEGKKVSGF